MRRGRLGHVLLLEEDAEDAEIFRSVFEKMRLPVDIDVVHSWRDFLGRARVRPRPDLIMIGVPVYGRDLVDGLGNLKADPEVGHIPVLILTDDDDPDHVRDCYTRHVAAYITKPIGLHDYEAFAKALHAFWFETATLLSD